MSQKLAYLYGYPDLCDDEGELNDVATDLLTIFMGVMMGAPVAVELGAGFVPARKPGKLPRETASQEYDLEYGTAELHIHKDAIHSGDKVLLVDDLIATGGTMVAQVKLVEHLGAELVGIACAMELEFFNPRSILAEVTDKQLHSLVKIK